MSSESLPYPRTSGKLGSSLNTAVYPAVKTPEATGGWRVAGGGWRVTGGGQEVTAASAIMARPVSQHPYGIPAGCRSAVGRCALSGGRQRVGCHALNTIFSTRSIQNTIQNGPYHHGGTVARCRDIWWCRQVWPLKLCLLGLYFFAVGYELQVGCRRGWKCHRHHIWLRFLLQVSVSDRLV